MLSVLFVCTHIHASVLHLGREVIYCHRHDMGWASPPGFPNYNFFCCPAQTHTHAHTQYTHRGCAPNTKGTAYVVYEDIFDAKNACEHLSGFNVCNRYLVVLYYQPHKVLIGPCTTMSICIYKTVLYHSAL